MAKKTGEVWKIRHSRKGLFTVRLLEDVSDGQEWVIAEITDGFAQYVNGGKEAGEQITMRVSLVEFLEQEVPNAN